MARRMKTPRTLVAVAATALFATGAGALAVGQHQEEGALSLSEDTLELLRAEMRVLAGAVQGMALAIAAGDWQSIESTSRAMRDSYVMAKQLTPAQAEELDTVLPERFKALDLEFHDRAGKLGAAASAHDAEQVVFHYSRLLENCVACHSLYARTKFTGFAAPAREEHRH